MSVTPRIVRNDWSSVSAPELGEWRPTLPVSVVIPGYRCQASLELTLASLAHQTYPPDLLEVIVVDDGSQPPLELPKLRPEQCRLITAGDHSDGWGRANALRVGAAHGDGAVIHWLDADMVVYPGHVEAQVRWHHQVPYAVTLGWKRFVDVAPGQPGWPSPGEVSEACAADAADRLFDGLPAAPHDYVERRIADTDQLRRAGDLSFLAHVGATAALRRELYQAAGGMNPTLRLGEDIELGFRLAQAGAVFVPEPAARSWHLGPSHMMRHQDALQRYNQPYLADLIPWPRWLRQVGGSGWAVPLVIAVMVVDGQPLELVRAAVDALLRGEEPDLRVVLVGPWSSLSDRRMSPLSDPLLDLRLLAASYRSDPRVQLAEQAPASGFPSPYLLTVPATCRLGRRAVRRLVERADQDQLGLVRVDAGPAGMVELWRTAALGRAGWVRSGREPLASTVAQVYGAGTASPARVGVTDLTGVPAAELAQGRVPIRIPASRWQPRSVEVAGVRSLGRATGLVVRLIVARAWAAIRSRTGVRVHRS